MPWLQLRMALDARDADAAEEALLAAGALSVTLDDAHDDPIYEPPPGATPLWPTTRVSGLFPGGADPDRVRLALAAALGPGPLPAHEFVALDDREWTREWLKDFKPMRFGRRLWVVPGAHAPPDPSAVNLSLDPGLAFGTGTHATTALCLEWLDAADDLAGATVVDYGCGSGVLAVAAALLGAERVLAVDTDPQALLATRENAERNGVSDRVEVAEPRPVAAGTAPRASLLVANILAAPLVALAPVFRALTADGARVAVSGLLERQVRDVQAAYADWCPLEGIVVRDGWVRLDGTRR